MFHFSRILLKYRLCVLPNRILYYGNTLFQYRVKNIFEIALVEWTHQLLQSVLVIFKLCLSFVKQVDDLFELLSVLFFSHFLLHFLTLFVLFTLLTLFYHKLIQPSNICFGIIHYAHISLDTTIKSGLSDVDMSRLDIGVFLFNIWRCLDCSLASWITVGQHCL